MKNIYLLLLLVLTACSTTYRGDELPNLKGKNTTEVMKILGKPVSERKEGDAIKMWAYCQQKCSTLIFFDSQDIVQYAEQRGDCSFE